MFTGGSSPDRGEGLDFMHDVEAEDEEGAGGSQRPGHGDGGAASVQSLLRGAPEEFDSLFADIIRRSPDRARIVARYLLADMLVFPETIVEEKLPEVHRMTQSLASKAGCPFAWAFLGFLPILSMPCSSARRWITEWS